LFAAIEEMYRIHLRSTTLLLIVNPSNFIRIIMTAFGTGLNRTVFQKENVGFTASGGQLCQAAFSPLLQVHRLWGLKLYKHILWFYFHLPHLFFLSLFAFLIRNLNFFVSNSCPLEGLGAVPFAKLAHIWLNKTILNGQLTVINKMYSKWSSKGKQFETYSQPTLRFPWLKLVGMVTPPTPPSVNIAGSLRHSYSGRRNLRERKR